ncbi:hypothetical protein BGX27_008127 [Mortierella sp. AM989]|nr:hypothetical protein BGX27_008127 [Mortierella sp. AM989]
MVSSKRFHLIPALALTLFLLALSSNNLAHANIFGVPVAKLSFDRISIRNKPSNIQNADTIAPGSDIPSGVISETGNIPRGGFSGILFDMGYACSPEFDANNTLLSPDFYGLPRMALIKRGGPTPDEACTFRTKLLNAIANNSIGAIIYTYEGSPAIEGATAALNSTEMPVEIPGLMITYEDGMMLRTLLQQTQDSGSVDFYNRVRVTMSMDQKMPVVWEFVLIIVVVLLAVSFTVSVVLHCRLYALRQRIRMDALARGADVLPNGTIRMRKITLDKAILDELPVRVYGQNQDSVVSLPEPTATAAAGTNPPSETTPASAGTSSSGESNTDLGKPLDSTLAHKTNSLISLTSLSRANSLKGSISGKSVRSIKAIAAATALNANTITQQAPSTAVNTFTSDVGEATSETCAVCLDEFSDGEEIRMLPCHHEFHCECIDPWLTRKSSTCPLCKYDCMPRTTEEVEGRGEDANIVIPNDRFIEFVMGPDWVASRTLRGYNGSSYIDRIGHFFGTLYDRARGRPPRPSPSATISPSARARAGTSSPPVPLDEHGQVPLQLITPNGVSIAPTSGTSTGQTPVPALATPTNPTISIDMPESTASQSESSPEAATTAPASQPSSDSVVAIDIPTVHEQRQ